MLHWYPPTGTRRINSPNSRQRHHCVQTTGRARLIRTQLIRSSTLFEVSVKCFPIISCFKGTVNSYFHLFRRKSLPTKDFELTMPLLQFFSKLTLLAFSVVVKTRCLGFYQKQYYNSKIIVLFLRKSKAELVLTNLKTFDTFVFHNYQK